MSNRNYYDYRWPDRSKTRDSSTPSWLVGMIAGAAVGGGLALMFAPRQGAATPVASPSRRRTGAARRRAARVSRFTPSTARPPRTVRASL